MFQKRTVGTRRLGCSSSRLEHVRFRPCEALAWPESANERKRIEGLEPGRHGLLEIALQIPGLHTGERK